MMMKAMRREPGAACCEGLAGADEEAGSWVGLELVEGFQSGEEGDGDAAAGGSTKETLGMEM